MTDYANNFAGLTSGNNVDSTSSATTGTPVVPTLNGATCKYDSANTPKGLTRAIVLTRTSGSQSFIGMATGAAFNTASGRVYFCLDAITNLGAGITMGFIRFYSDQGGSGISATLGIYLDGSNKLRAEDSSGTQHSSISATGITAGVWYYALPRDTADSAAGVLTVDIYKDSDDSLFSTLAWSGFSTRGGNIVELRMGFLVSNAYVTNMRLAGIAVRTNSITSLGGVGANNAPTANAGPDQTNVEPFDTIPLDGSGSADLDGDALTYAWTQTSGTTTALSSTTAQKPSLVAPNTMAGTTLRYQLIVTDTHAAASAADTVDIVVLPTTTAVRVGGVLVPAQMKVFKP